MRAPTLDPRFLSRSRREQLGLPWSTQATPTTTQTSPETSPTECASTDASGSSFEGPTGTAGATWWEMDLTRWPGPSEETEWEQTLYLARTQFALASRAFGKIFKSLEDAMQALNFNLVEGEPVHPGIRVGYPKGPTKGKPQRTFDRMGRRVR